MKHLSILALSFRLLLSFTCKTRAFIPLFVCVISLLVCGDGGKSSTLADGAVDSAASTSDSGHANALVEEDFSDSDFSIEDLSSVRTDVQLLWLGVWHGHETTGEIEVDLAPLC